MQSPEEFILKHAALPYDATKAHEYYIRNRQLKGRMAKLSTVNHPIPRSKMSFDLKNENWKDPVGIKPGVFKPKKTITSQRQQQVQARVKVLKGKLKVLNTLLSDLVKKAQGPTSTKRTKSVGTKTSAAGSDSKKLTPAQKREAAKKAKANYEKDPGVQEKRKQKEAQQKKIKEVKHQIEQVRTELKAAIANARKMSTKKEPAARAAATLRKG